MGRSRRHRREAEEALEPVAEQIVDWAMEHVANDFEANQK